MVVKDKIKALREALEQHNYNYYVLSAPTISDREFDEMMKELQVLEEAHPEYADPHSPTQRDVYKRQTLHEGDTLVLWADDTFVPTWGESSVFLLLANGKDGTEPVSRKKRWLALGLLIFMIVGATIGELPVVKEAFPEIRLDMFFFVCITTIIMAWTKIFPPKKYTKYISWDILITIACAFAISKAMENSGFAALIARHIIGMSSSCLLYTSSNTIPGLSPSHINAPIMPTNASNTNIISKFILSIDN